MDKIVTFTTKMFEILDKDSNDLSKEVIAAISLNPTLRWIKFVVTDDQPNANKQRIPKSEFANLIKTGLHMPIKMAQGFIREGHEFSVPIGTITGLRDADTFVEGIAALWGKEFPTEVQLLRDMHDTDERPQLSWEILYSDSSIDKDTEIEDFEDVALSAVTVVGMPAYEGRTPIVSMAALEAYRITQEEQEDMEKTLEDLTKLVEDLKGEKATLQEEFDTLSDEMKVLKVEHGELVSFKEKVEAASARSERIVALIELFSNSGVAISEEDFGEKGKAEKLLSMELDQLEFLLQDLALFSSEEAGGEKDGEGEAGAKHLGSKSLENLNLTNEDDDDEEWTISRIAKKLKEDRKESLSK